MSIRTIIFCDICNPQGLRSIEFRRAPRDNERSGRRISDGRSWYEGSIYEATASAGWVISEEGEHICPDCQESHASSK
jgi:hypothetical protein